MGPQGILHLIAAAFAIATFTGCGSLNSGNKWGERAVSSFEWKRIPVMKVH